MFGKVVASSYAAAAVPIQTTVSFDRGPCAASCKTARIDSSPPAVVTSSSAFAATASPPPVPHALFASAGRSHAPVPHRPSAASANVLQGWSGRNDGGEMHASTWTTDVSAVSATHRVSVGPCQALSAATFCIPGGFLRGCGPHFTAALLVHGSSGASSPARELLVGNAAGEHSWPRKAAACGPACDEMFGPQL